MADMSNMQMPPAPAPAPQPAMPPSGPQGNPAIASPQQGIPDMFPVMDGPTPGQSLTNEPRAWAWERPPQFTSPEDASDFVWRMLTKPPVTKSTLTMLDQGVPVEALARTLLFKGFSEGKWTMDVAMLIYKHVNLMIATLGRAAGIKVKLHLKEPDPLEATRTTYNQVAKNDYMNKEPEQGIDLLETAKKTQPMPMLGRKGNK